MALGGGRARGRSPVTTHTMRFLLLVALGACQCPPPGSLTGGHFVAAGELRDAVYRGDAGALATAAQAMDGGRAAEHGDAAAGERLHGALGFLQVSEDTVERGEGLAAVARACGDCHRQAGVRVPVRAAAEAGCPQAAAAEALWWKLLAGEGSERDEAALAAGAAECAGCHPGG